MAFLVIKQKCKVHEFSCFFFLRHPMPITACTPPHTHHSIPITICSPSHLYHPVPTIPNFSLIMGFLVRFNKQIISQRSLGWLFWSSSKNVRCMSLVVFLPPPPRTHHPVPIITCPPPHVHHSVPITPYPPPQTHQPLPTTLCLSLHVHHSVASQTVKSRLLVPATLAISDPHHCG